MANHYFDTVISTLGRALRNAIIRVRDEGGLYVTIYSDDGVTQIDQNLSPVKTDTKGFFEFWTDETSVYIDIEYGGKVTKIIKQVPTLGEGFVDYVNGIYDRAPINPKLLGAGGAGVTDDTAAMQAAINLSRATGRPISASGVFRIDGTLDPSGATFIHPNQYSRENDTVSDWGMVIQQNSLSASLFAPTAGGFTFDGIVLHDPRQTGGAPVARPPMFDITGTYHATDVTFNDCTFVNPYDFVHTGSTAIAGDWRITDCRGYAVRYAFDFEGFVPEIFFCSDNIWSPGVWQSGAIGVNSAQLAKWTAINGAILHVNNASLSVDGWKSDNEIIFGYKNVVLVRSGLLNVSTFQGYSWDQCLQPLRVQGTGGMVATFDGGKAYCLAYGDPAQSLSAFSFVGSGIYNVNLKVQGQYASGEWFRIVNAGTGSISIEGSFKDWGSATGTTNRNFCDVEAPNINLSVRPSSVISSKTDQNGVNVTDIRTLNVSTMFSGLVQALVIASAPSAYKMRDSSLVVQTGATNSYSNLSGSKFDAAGTYDKP